MNDANFVALEAQARRVRAHCIRMATDGGCFLGASLSCADLLVYLYDRVLRVDPARLDDPKRDYLLLSKGHDVPALYGTLAERGYFPTARLANHLSMEDHLYWHPNRAIPGVEFHSGSLGHLLSVGMGIAVDARLRGDPSRVFVIVGDGELDALADKLRAFGFGVTDVDGHSFPALNEAFARLPIASGRPSAIIARTVRGKGLPSIEARADRWFVDFTKQEVAMLLEELEGTARAHLTSVPLVVR